MELVDHTSSSLCVDTLTLDSLQSILRESSDKDVAAMLVELTIEADEESFVIVLQHGGNDVTCKEDTNGYDQKHEPTIFLPSGIHTKAKPKTNPKLRVTCLVCIPLVKNIAS